jgi:hypothetical protein
MAVGEEEEDVDVDVDVDVDGVNLVYLVVERSTSFADAYDNARKETIVTIAVSI